MPRLGMGMPIAGGATEAAVLAVEDFVFLNDVSGELTPVDTSSRTNLVLYSEDFSEWANSGLTLSLNSATAPDGNATADNIVYGGSAGSPNGKQIQVAVGIGGGNANKTFTFSVHVKGTGTFRLKNTHGEVVDNYSSNLTATSDFVRYDFSVSNSSSAGNGYQLVAVVAASTDAAFNLDIWGAQLEEDSRVSNYIPTSGSAVSVATTELTDLSNVWDFDGTDIMLEVDPENEGAFEEATANLVLNHDYEELGSELVTNGNFATDSDWTKGAGWTISNNKASFNTTSNSSLVQNLSITSGQTYRIQITGEITSGALKLTNSSGLGNDSSFSLPLDTVYTHDGGGDRIEIRTINAAVGHLDSVSVKEVDPNDRWTLGTGWSISGGKLIGDGTNTDFQSAQQNNVTVVGDTYEATVTVEATSGQVELKGSAVYKRIDTLGVGTHTFTFVADSTNIRFLAHASATITLDNFTVKEYAITPLNV